MYFWYLKASLKFFSRHFVRKCSPKCLESINILRFQKYFKLRIKWLFLYNELWSYMFYDRFYDLYFENLRILFIFKIFRQSKYITGFKKFWGIFVVHNFSKKFFQTWSNFKKNDRNYQNCQILTNEIANWEQMTRSYWLNSVCER